MKLYKQKLIDIQELNDPILIMEADSFEVLRKEAERLAAIDGCLEYPWVSGNQSNPKFEFPKELFVNDLYKLIIRDW